MKCFFCNRERKLKESYFRIFVYGTPKQLKKMACVECTNLEKKGQL